MLKGVVARRGDVTAPIGPRRGWSLQQGFADRSLYRGLSLETNQTISKCQLYDL